MGGREGTVGIVCRRPRHKQLCLLSEALSTFLPRSRSKCLAAIYLPRNDSKVSLSVLMSYGCS